MATTRQPPPVAAAGDDPPAPASPDDSTEQALARSREIRAQANRQIRAAREHVATVRRQRSDPSARSGPAARAPAARILDAGEEIKRSRQVRAHLAELAAKLVQTEETIAHIHDKMADRDSGHAAQYRRAADDARQAASRAREIQRNAAGPDPR